MPSPGPWAWILCTFTGVSGLGPRAQDGGLPWEAPLTARRPRFRRHSGLLSALGLALADVVHEAQEPCSLPYVPETFMQLDQRLSRLEEQCMDALRAQGFPRWSPGGIPVTLDAVTSPMVPGPLGAMLRGDGP